MGMTKQEFVSSWENYIQEFGRLGHSTDSPEVWDRIKALREEMRRVIHEVADEHYARSTTKQYMEQK